MSEGTVTREDLNKQIDDRLPGLVTDAVAKALDGLKASPGLPIDLDNSITRDRKFHVKDADTGIAAGRYVRAMAFAKGDMHRAADFIKRVYDDPLGDEVQKALISSELTSGGALVPPEYVAEIIELLRAMSIVRSAGARTLPMNNGTLTIRKQTSGSNAAYVGESQDIAISQPDTGLIEMTSKKLAAIVPISNDLLTFTSGPSADEFVRDDLVIEMALREDLAFIRDDGTSNTPRGLRFWADAANILSTNGETATQIEDDFKDLLNALELKDVRLLRPVWFMNPRSKNHLRNLRDANGNLIYPEMRLASPTMYSWPVFTTTNIPANLGGGTETEIYFVDMIDAIIAEASTLEIEVNSSASYIENATLQSAFSRDETLVRAIARHDFAMRHRESVAVMTDVIWGA